MEKITNEMGTWDFAEVFGNYRDPNGRKWAMSIEFRTQSIPWSKHPNNRALGPKIPLILQYLGPKALLLGSLDP